MLGEERRGEERRGERVFVDVVVFSLPFTLKGDFD